MADRFDASLAALRRGDVDEAAELELSQRKRSVTRTFRIPVELDELLQDRAGEDETTLNEIGILALWAFLDRS